MQGYMKLSWDMFSNVFLQHIDTVGRAVLCCFLELVKEENREELVNPDLPEKEPLKY